MPSNTESTATPPAGCGAAARLRARRAFVVASLSALASLGLLSGATAEASTRSRARAASSMAVNENVKLHLVSRHGLSRVYEQGNGTGTFHCTVTLNLTISNVAQVNAEFVVNAPGGTIDGRGKGSYHVSGTTGYFSGDFSISHGTGRYAHATGSGLTAKGTISRSTYAVSMKISGTVRL